MSLLLRPRTPIPPLLRTCLSVLCALGLLAAPAVGTAAPRSTKKSSKSSSSKTSATKPADTSDTPAPDAAPAPAEAPAAAPVVEKKPVEEPPRPAPEPRPATSKPSSAARPTPAPAPATPAAASPVGRLRIGVGPDLFLESARMTGEQDINTSRQDESFDYSSAGFLSGSAWLTSAVPSVTERLRVGAGVRIFGNYAAGGGRTFGFGLLNEVFVSGEYGLPVAESTEVLFGARVGLSVLVPNSSLAEEIRRLQEQGASVWSVPRFGWLAGPSVGVRRRMSERIWLRADVLAHIEEQYLFATSQDITEQGSTLHFAKSWSTLALRLGLSLGAEFAL